MEQSLQDMLVGLEDGAVLVECRDGDLVGNILEVDKVGGEVSTKVFQLIAVVLDEIFSIFDFRFTIFDFRFSFYVFVFVIVIQTQHGGAFHHVTGEGFRGF